MNLILPIFVCLAYGISVLLECALGLSDDVAIKAIKSLSNKDKKTIAVRIKEYLARFIKLTPHKQQEIELLLRRSSKKLTPEEFYVELILKCFLYFASSFLLIMLGMNLLSLMIFVLAPLSIINSKSKLKEEASQYSDNLTKELPQFINFLIQSFNKEFDLVSAVEKYREVAKDELKYELDILLSELKTGSYEVALINFDRRLSIQILTFLVTGLINANKGVDQSVYFYTLEQEVRHIIIKRDREELEARPKNLRWTSVSIFLGFLAIVGYSTIVFIYQHLRVLY